MKVRNGFVSNSSSSSFVIVVKKEDYDEVYKNLSEDAKEIADEIVTSQKAFGMDLAIYSGFTDNDGRNQLDYINIDNKYKINDELQGKLISLENLYHSQDW